MLQLKRNHLILEQEKKQQLEQDQLQLARPWPTISQSDDIRILPITPFTSTKVGAEFINIYNLKKWSKSNLIPQTLPQIRMYISEYYCATHYFQDFFRESVQSFFGLIIPDDIINHVCTFLRTNHKLTSSSKSVNSKTLQIPAPSDDDTDEENTEVDGEQMFDFQNANAFSSQLYTCKESASKLPIDYIKDESSKISIHLDLKKFSFDDLPRSEKPITKTLPNYKTLSFVIGIRSGICTSFNFTFMMRITTKNNHKQYYFIPFLMSEMNKKIKNKTLLYTQYFFRLQNDTREAPKDLKVEYFIWNNTHTSFCGYIISD